LFAPGNFKTAAFPGSGSNTDGQYAQAAGNDAIRVIDNKSKSLAKRKFPLVFSSSRKPRRAGPIDQARAAATREKNPSHFSRQLMKNIPHEIKGKSRLW